MKILFVDIETAPMEGYFWGIWQENIRLSQILSNGYILSWAAKWSDSKQLLSSDKLRDGEKSMLKKIHELLDKADVVVHYNGQRFDVPTLNREFAKLGMKPPSPFKQVDIYRVVRRVFKLPSNKMEYVAKFFGVKEKTPLEFKVWRECMEGKASAFKTLVAYNKDDVLVLEEIYNKLLPWIPNHPNHGLYQERKAVCPNCGKSDYQHRGLARTSVQTYLRFQCKPCGKWFRDNTSIDPRTKGVMFKGMQ